MSRRIRRCVECPKCHTRYLIAFTFYRNGAFLMSPIAETSREYALYCSCGRPANVSHWSWNQLKRYKVANEAHDRGYGSPEEIVPLAEKRQAS